MKAPNVLSDLARRIEIEHNAVGTALLTALGHAIAAGELLIEAKKQAGHGKWLSWLEANSSVPKRTAAHYMALAKARAKLTDENGNVLPISVNSALGLLNPDFNISPEKLLMRHSDNGGSDDGGSFNEWGERHRAEWGPTAWNKFGEALHKVVSLPQLNPPRPAVVAKAARAGKTPGLTAEILRENAALLVSYADAIEPAAPKPSIFFQDGKDRYGLLTHLDHTPSETPECIANATEPAEPEEPEEYRSATWPGHRISAAYREACHLMAKGPRTEQPPEKLPEEYESGLDQIKQTLWEFIDYFKDHPNNTFDNVRQRLIDELSAMETMEEQAQREAAE